MKKSVILGVMVLVATAAVALPASAHDRDCEDGYSSRGRYNSRYSRGGAYAGNYNRGGYYGSGYGDAYSDRGYNTYGYGYGRDDRHDREDARLARLHERAHERGIYSEAQHERLHQRLEDRHDVIHHRIYGEHAPERQGRYRDRSYYTGYGY